VRLAVLEPGLQARVSETETPPWTVDRPRSLNPLAKVPALLADTGLARHESGMICDCRDQLAAAPCCFRRPATHAGGPCGCPTPAEPPELPAGCVPAGLYNRPVHRTVGEVAGPRKAKLLPKAQRP
jgi:hypothetical protein